MLKEAIYHRPRNNYAYFENDTTAHLMLRAKYDDLCKAELIFFDKYDTANTRCQIELSLYLSDSLFSYYCADVTPPYRRLAYYFLLTDKCGDTLYFDELGFHTNETYCERDAFQIPYLNQTDAITIPAWAKDAIFYQIFPDSFARSESVCTTQKFPEWGSEPDIVKHLGGNLRGIIEHFDYFTDLGVNAFYFCPIFQSNSCHRYNTYDYRTIDPALGTIDDFKELLDLCHKNGIKLLLDAVFNHTCDTFPAFMDVIEKGEDSAYKDWYFINEYPVTVDEKYRYERFSFERHMPKLNTANPEVREYLLDVVAYWTNMGIDGWRLDVANEIDLDFWRAFRKTVKSINPDAFILGEMWNDSQPYLGGDMMDSAMNYPFETACELYFLKQEIGTDEFKDLITNRLICYPQASTYAMYNLLGSHDTPRWYTLANNDLKRVSLSVVFQFCFVGMPAIYYGDENAMKGEDFVLARRCMDFHPGEEGQQLHQLYKKMIDLRKENKVFTDGSFEWVTLTDENGYSPLCFKRKCENEEVALIINNTDASITLNAEETKKAFPWCENIQNFTIMEPYSYHILMKEDKNA